MKHLRQHSCYILALRKERKEKKTTTNHSTPKPYFNKNKYTLQNFSPPINTHKLTTQGMTPFNRVFKKNNFKKNGKKKTFR